MADDNNPSQQPQQPVPPPQQPQPPQQQPQQSQQQRNEEYAADYVKPERLTLSGIILGVVLFLGIALLIGYCAPSNKNNNTTTQTEETKTVVTNQNGQELPFVHGDDVKAPEPPPQIPGQTTAVTAPVIVTAPAVITPAVVPANTLRCGYIAWEPGLIVDDAGKISGIFYDLVNQTAAKLNMNVQWTLQSEFGKELQGLTNNLYDMVCSPNIIGYINDTNVIYTDPVYATKIGLWYRPDISGIGSYQDLNKLTMRVAVIPGDITKRLADTYTPSATQVPYPKGTSLDLIIADIQNKTVDFVFAENYATQSLANNEKIKLLTLGQNIAELKVGMLALRSNAAFITKWNSAMKEILSQNQYKDYFKKYVDYPNAIDTSPAAIKR